MNGLDSILVRVYPDKIPPGIAGTPERGHVRRYLELTPYPETARFTATVRWEYSDYSLDTREVSQDVQDERMLRGFGYDGSSYRGLISRVNTHGNFATIDGVTEVLAGPGKHIALLMSGTYTQKWNRLPLLSLWHRFSAIDRMAPTHLGLAGDQGLFLHSTDGGATWAESYTGQSTPLYGLTAGSDWMACGAVGSLYRSSDGSNWTRVNIATRKDLYALATVTGGPRLLAGDGVLFRSTDNGATWSPRAVDSTVSYRALHPLTSSRILAVGGKGRILLSTDAGSSWSLKHTAGGMTLHAVRSFVGKYCWAAGDSGAVLFSADSGATWTRKVFPKSVSLKAVWPEDVARAFAAGENGSIYYTTDQGSSWFSQYTADTHDLQALLFTDPSHGFAVGSGGTILTTASAGTTTQVPAAATAVPTEFALEQNYPNPFNPVTTIAFTIPGERSNGDGPGGRGTGLEPGWNWWSTTFWGGRWPLLCAKIWLRGSIRSGLTQEGWHPACICIA